VPPNPTCPTCGGSGYTRRLGANNDEIVEDCPDRAHLHPLDAAVPMPHDFTDVEVHARMRATPDGLGFDLTKKSVSIRGPSLTVVWIQHEITESGTARVWRRHGVISAIPCRSDISAETYRDWIRSWIETHWTPTLSEYLVLAAKEIE